MAFTLMDEVVQTMVGLTEKVEKEAEDSYREELEEDH